MVEPDQGGIGTGRAHMKYGFVGLGNLGEHLAGSLLRGGFGVTVTDLDRTAAERLLKR